jgi:ribosomal protein L37AE/L43A
MTIHKIRNGYVIDTCQKCGETKVALNEVDDIWMCELCKDVYKNSLKAPKQVKEIEKQQSRFKEMTEV